MNKAKITAVCGMTTALSVVLMMTSTLLPVLMYVLPVVTSLGVLYVRDLSNKKWAFGVYAATSVLSMILLTDKETALTYVLFFGYYTLVKNSFEKLPKIVSRLIKTLVFNAAAITIGILGVWLFGVSGEEYSEFGKLTIPLLLGLANLAFVLYDFAITKNGILIELLARKTKKILRLR
ncbi:MAG: hypothetical protein IJ025_01120 [Clostridia bacterium]|nr:hypothetical protein [Clostridia bacterium]